MQILVFLCMCRYITCCNDPCVARAWQVRKDSAPLAVETSDVPVATPAVVACFFAKHLTLCIECFHIMSCSLFNTSPMRMHDRPAGANAHA